MPAPIAIVYENCAPLAPLFDAFCDAARQAGRTVPFSRPVPPSADDRARPDVYVASFGEGDFYVLRPGGRPACASDLFLPGLLDDRRDPTPAGYYFCACLLYAAVTGESPVGIPFCGPLSEEDAALWQQTAALVL